MKFSRAALQDLEVSTVAQAFIERYGARAGVQHIEAQYDLIKQKKSRLSSKLRKQIIKLMERR